MGPTPEREGRVLGGEEAGSGGERERREGDPGERAHQADLRRVEPMPAAGARQGRYASPAMGQTRVDLQHLLEDLRDAYPDAIEETILSEVVANSLDSGASSVHVLTDPTEKTVVVVDDGCGMSRRELARYHDLAASTKTRGEGIGFAGVGIKLGLLVAEAVLTETRRGSVHVATRWHLASRQKAPWQWVPPPGWVGARGTAVGLKLRNPLSPLLDAGYVEGRLCAALRAALRPGLRRDPGRSLPVRRALLGERARARAAPRGGGGGERDARRAPAPQEEAGGRRPSRARRVAAPRGPAGARGQHPRQGDPPGVGLDRPLVLVARPRRRAIEAPGLSAALTLNKGDFVRAGRRGITYLAYRKALQEAVQAQLTAWGEARDREDSARRRAARPLEKDLEAVLLDLADEFPALAALVERRPGGQKRLPTGNETLPDSAGAAVTTEARRRHRPRASAEPRAAAPGTRTHGHPRAGARSEGSLQPPAGAAVHVGRPATASRSTSRTVRSHHLGASSSPPFSSTPRTPRTCARRLPRPRATTRRSPWAWRSRRSRSSPWAPRCS